MKCAVLAGGLLILGAYQATAQEDATGAVGNEAGFLQSLEGRFRGSGTFQKAQSDGRSLTCNLTADSQGNRLTLGGRCSAAVVFSTSVNIDMRYDPVSRRYVGSYRDGTGTVANLVGSRNGRTIALAFNETPESVRPGPPARLTIANSGDRLSLSLKSSRADAGQNLNISLDKQ